MSRIGKLPIPIPSGVKINQENSSVQIEGPRGALLQHVPAGINVSVEDSTMLVSRETDSRQHRSLHGLVRSLLANHVRGVSEGYTRTLDIVGVGYRAELSGDTLRLDVGFSHGVEIQPRAGIRFEVGQDTNSRQFFVIVNGIDKQVVGQTAADIRSVRPPEPYKGKGIRYRGEQVRRKIGKSGVGGSF